MPTPEIAEFGGHVASVLVGTLKDDLVGAYSSAAAAQDVVRGGTLGKVVIGV